MKRITKSHQDKINLAIQFIEKNLDQSIDLDQIAKASFLSTYHFHRLFHASVGLTPRVFVEKLKLERAGFLLSITNLSIADIAWELSYENPESFARSFKKFFQTTPSEFRKKHSRLSKNSNEKYEVSSEWAIYKTPNKNKISINKNLTHIILDTTTFAYYRYIGVWEKAHKIWRKLIDKCLQLGLFNQNAKLIGIWYDDPILVGKDQQRFDLGIRLPLEYSNYDILTEKHGMSIHRFRGNYLSYTYKGDFRNLEEVYMDLYTYLANETSFQLSNKPVIEIYKKFPPFYSPQDSEVDLYIPIHSQD